MSDGDPGATRPASPSPRGDLTRWWIVMALLLSLGVNLGLVASFWLRRDPVPPPAGPSATAAPRMEIPGLGVLADRLRLEGERRQRFLEHHRAFFEHLRRSLPRIERLRRELYREMVSPRPDPERLQRLVRDLGQTTIGVERSLVEVTLRSRELLDPAQEQMYLRFLSRRLRPVREALTPATPRPPARPPTEGRGPE